MRMLYNNLHDNISFQTQLIDWKQYFYFFDKETLNITQVPRNQSQQNSYQCIVMRMLYLKLHVHISFQTQVIDWKPFFYFFAKVTLTLTQVPRKQSQPRSCHEDAIYQVSLPYCIPN